MRRPADWQRRGAETQRPQSFFGSLLCASAPLRLIPIAAAALALAGTLRASVPGTPKLPMMSRPVTATSTTIDAPALKRLLFGVGVGFDRISGAQGMAISRVLPDSPASRAGLAVGCVIMEINGVVTVGRTGEDCARIIQNAFGPVRMKFLDPEQKEKTLMIEKAWLAVPENAAP